MAEDLFLSWDELHRDAKALAGLLAGRGPIGGAFRGVVGISRGGLVPAAVVARELTILTVEVVSISSYDHQKKGEPKLLKAAAAAGDGEGWLVVDDLVDGGDTMRLVSQLMPKALRAAVYAKPRGEPLLHVFARTLPQELWVHFPWDCAPRYVAPIAG
jgi:xanthine phosphoribosyltransferase